MSFSISLSGLEAASTALSTISNNLANLDTVGYKEQSVNFADLYYQTIGTTGGGDVVQVGSGTTVSSITTNFKSGTPDSTGISTDAAISGSGYFVTDVNGTYEYTRDGEFTTDDEGYLVTSDGSYVLGYSATNGELDTSSLSKIYVGSGLTSDANPTSSVEMTTNLDADADSGTTYSTSVTVYDSLGDDHVLTYTYTKTDENTWDYAVTIDGDDVGSTDSEVTLASGTLTFDADGNLTDPSSSDTTAFTINDLADGASDLTVSWELYDDAGNSYVTQTASDSGTSSTTQDGYACGTLEDITIESDGTIEGTFTNGTQVIGELVLATFANEQGLERDGSNNYIATLSSGQAVIGTAGSGGRGTITGGSVELSNVDMSTEFANLIVAERLFQSNAKAVTTLDEVTQTTINLIQ